MTFTFASEPPETRSFSNSPENPPASEQPVSAPVAASPVLWGGAAAGLIGAATYIALEAQRKRKEEEQRKIQEMHRLNAEMRAREKQEALLIAQRREAAALLAAMAAGEVSQGKLEDEEEAWLEKKIAQDKVANQFANTQDTKITEKGSIKLAVPIKPPHPPIRRYPEEVDTSKLTKYSSKGNGKDLFNRYLDLFKDTKGWWWKRGKFPIINFIGMNWGYELGVVSRDPKTRLEAFELYKEAMTRASHEYCQELVRKVPTFECSASTIEGQLNFQAYYSESTQNRLYVDKTLMYLPYSSSLFSELPPKTVSDGIELTNTMLNPIQAGHPEWTDGFNQDRPYSVGNGYLIEEKAKGKLKFIVDNEYYLFATNDLVTNYDQSPDGISVNDNVLFILSGCQSLYMNDMGLFEAYGCPMPVLKKP